MTNQDKYTQNKKLSFFQQLKNTYSFYKKCYQQDRLIFGEFSTFKQNKTNEERTSSKSKKKKIISPLKVIRKSTRLKTSQQDKLKQISKQPLWQPSRRRKDNRQERKTRTPILNEMKSIPKIKSSNPLYEFYSQYPDLDEEIVKNKSDFRQKSKKKQITEQKQKEIIIQQKQQINKNTIQQNSNVQQLENQQMIENWVPNKQQKSLLSIQRIIDQYLLFKLSMRNNQVAMLSELINYVREIKGYYFNQNVLTQMLKINSKLYKVLVIDNEKYIKCPKLSHKLIQTRLLSTKIKMKNSGQQ